VYVNPTIPDNAYQCGKKQLLVTLVYAEPEVGGRSGSNRQDDQPESRRLRIVLENLSPFLSPCTPEPQVYSFIAITIVL